jgi:hypothetical protein
MITLALAFALQQAQGPPQRLSVIVSFDYYPPPLRLVILSSEPNIKWHLDPSRAILRATPTSPDNKPTLAFADAAPTQPKWSKGGYGEISAPLKLDRGGNGAGFYHITEDFSKAILRDDGGPLRVLDDLDWTIYLPAPESFDDLDAPPSRLRPKSPPASNARMAWQVNCQAIQA